MGLKSSLSLPFAKYAMKKLRSDTERAVDIQKKMLASLLKDAEHTEFGRDHKFSQISSHADYAKAVPIRDYEAFAKYTERIIAGVPDVLWKGLPTYVCKTSGTTSGVKYIPISKESMPSHINAARNALLSYIAESRNPSFVNGKMIFLQGSPELHPLESGIPYGRLSGIVAHHVPKYLQKNRLPSYQTNCIDDWETKVMAIVKETVGQDLTLIGGIPSWVQMYYEKLLEYTGADTVSEVFPNLGLFVYGGVNFEPYSQKFKSLVGKDIPSIETYPASEGFIAFQDQQASKALLLNVNGGLFFEFVKADEMHNDTPKRLTLEDVELGVNYALILTSNAGLWAYSIGDTIKFTSIDPYRIRVTGRIKHFTSAFGEHVIAEEVEAAMSIALEQTNATLSEFHLAPMIEVSEGLPYHQWLVEFDQEPKDHSAFAGILDDQLRKMNPYYDDLIVGNILRKAKLEALPKGTFMRFMQSRGKLGGQNKIPRLSNDRLTADQIIAARS